jgi:hypothetical protein
MNMAYPGYQRLVALNGIPIYVQDSFVPETDQELRMEKFIQGGPRTSIYYMGYRVVKGQFQVPFSLTPEGDIDPGVKELLNAAQYPLATNKLSTNYFLSQYGITAINNRGFGKYLRMALDPFGITNLSLSVPNKGPVMLDVQFIAMVSETEAGVTPDPSVSSLMRRNLIYADCDVRLGTPEYHWETTRSFKMTVKNEIPPIVVLRNYESETDQPEMLSMGTSEVWGEISYSVDRGTLFDEMDSLPSGGYFGQDLVFDFSGIALATFPYVVMKVTDQPIRGTEIMERTTKFLATFDCPALTATVGHFITFPIDEDD